MNLFKTNKKCDNIIYINGKNITITDCLFVIDDNKIPHSVFVLGPNSANCVIERCLFTPQSTANNHCLEHTRKLNDTIKLLLEKNRILENILND